MVSLPHILSYYDILLTPVYLLLLIFFIVQWKKKKYAQSPLKKYMLPAFLLKAVSCILLALLYEFYYGYSDAHNYYTGAMDIWHATKSNPVYGLELVFKPFDKCSLPAQEFGSYIGSQPFSPGIINMFKTAGFIGMFCFGTYLPIALIISLLCFIGSWKIFMVFAEEFPEYAKKIALTALFAPSFVFWGTNIMKDPLAIFGLGLAVSSLYAIMKKRAGLLTAIELVFGCLVMLAFKSYVFYLFLVAAICSMYTHVISVSPMRFRFLLRLMLVIFLTGTTIFAIASRGYITEIFAADFVKDVTFIQNVQKDLGGSVYVLPNVEDNSFIGIVRTYFRSLNVALFRPYLWEVPNLIAIANALESFVVMVFTFYLLLKLKIIGFFGPAFHNRLLTFSLVFVLLLAPLAGLVSFNFGTLVRYKAPAVPFCYTYLMVLFLTVKKNKGLKRKSTENNGASG